MNDAQKGYIHLPGWFFWLAPIAVVLIFVEVARVALWIYEHVEVILK